MKGVKRSQPYPCLLVLILGFTASLSPAQGQENVIETEKFNPATIHAVDRQRDGRTAVKQISPGQVAAGLNAAEASTHQVNIVDFMRFEPEEITIKTGEDVTWVNRDGSNHKIKFSDSTSPRLRHDASYRKRFESPGSYEYICEIHGKKMSGRVLVNAR